MDENYLKEEYDFYLQNIADKTIVNYIEKRIIGQIAWYDKKSTEKQQAFHKWTVASIIMNALIPVITLFLPITNPNFDLLTRIGISSLSASSAVIFSTIGLCNYKELWIQYRVNCELLKSVLHQFFTKTGVFLDKEETHAFNLLVISCEEYLTKEFQTWATITNKPVSNNNSQSTGS